jgi:hypothetical protein
MTLWPRLEYIIGQQTDVVSTVNQTPYAEQTLFDEHVDPFVTKRLVDVADERRLPAQRV